MKLQVFLAVYSFLCSKIITLESVLPVKPAPILQAQYDHKLPDV